MVRLPFIEGAPDVVVEVLSPATSATDQRQKKALWEVFEVEGPREGGWRKRATGGDLEADQS